MSPMFWMLKLPAVPDGPRSMAPPRRAITPGAIGRVVDVVLVEEVDVVDDVDEVVELEVVVPSTEVVVRPEATSSPSLPPATPKARAKMARRVATMATTATTHGHGLRPRPMAATTGVAAVGGDERAPAATAANAMLETATASVEDPLAPHRGGAGTSGTPASRASGDTIVRFRSPQVSHPSTWPGDPLAQQRRRARRPRRPQDRGELRAVGAPGAGDEQGAQDCARACRGGREASRRRCWREMPIASARSWPSRACRRWRSRSAWSSGGEAAGGVPHEAPQVVDRRARPLVEVDGHGAQLAGFVLAQVLGGHRRGRGRGGAGRPRCGRWRRATGAGGTGREAAGGARRR